MVINIKILYGKAWNKFNGKKLKESAENSQLKSKYKLHDKFYYKFDKNDYELQRYYEITNIKLLNGEFIYTLSAFNSMIIQMNIFLIDIMLLKIILQHITFLKTLLVRK